MKIPGMERITIKNNKEMSVNKKSTNIGIKKCRVNDKAMRMDEMPV